MPSRTAPHILGLAPPGTGKTRRCGWLLKRTVTLLIPNTLRAFPIAALLGSGAALGLVLVLLYHPRPSLWQIVVTPWLCLQVAAIPAVAGMYGALEGWLAVAGSDLWWPLVPIGCAIAVLIKSRRPQTVAARQVPYRHAPTPQSQPHSVPPSGWAYVPVWVGPAPQSAMPVIDAEVIEEPR